MKVKTKIIQATDTIQAELPDGRLIEGPRGGTVEQFLEPISSELQYPLVASIVNKELRELSFPLLCNSNIAPITTADSDGKNIYRRSLVYLLSAVFEQIMPDHALLVDHSIHSGGLFCRIVGPELDDSSASYRRLENEMRQLVKQNLPVVRESISLDEARELFAGKHQQEKVDLLQYRKKDFLTTYRLGDFVDYHYGYMVPSTGYLRTFAIEPATNPNEFFLRYPSDGISGKIQKLSEAPKMMDEFRRYGSWLERLGIASIASLNQAIEKDRIQEVILVSEALHNQKIVQIATGIMDRMSDVRVVLIAGPSSSGKTTFSKRLSIELLSQGISPVPIEMDDFFVDRELSPIAPDGSYDFESVENLNLELMDDSIHRLIAGEQVQLPHYDFLDGKSKPGKVMQIKKGQIIILEGIHAMNPKLLPGIQSNQKYLIFASPLTQVNVDRYNRVSIVDTRLLRRVVRDYRDRGYSAQETIGRWGSVRRGEEKYIIPYQRLADEYMNTSLVYELSALKPLAETALRQVQWGSTEHLEAKRLLSFLEWVLPLPDGLIPPNSILAEFTGGSNLKNFTVWE